jgi:GTP cyclohydrolase I
MIMRGIKKANATMTTSAMRGSFKKNATTRAEFMELVKQS